jgi:RHS repeat-associated protein
MMNQANRNSISQYPASASESGEKRAAGQNTVQAPSLTLPTGGGAIRGIDEKFKVNPASGSGAMTIPIPTSPARQGFGPQLALGYDSGSGSGPFGLGWSLSLPRIDRKTDKGLPTYRDGEASDVFVLSGAEDLVPLLVDNDEEGLTRHSQLRMLDEVPYLVQRYRPRIEGLFARIERWTNQQTGEIHWRSITRDNVTTLYGRTNESRIADPGDSSRIFSWLICESYDDKGNAMVYRYKAEDSASVDRSRLNERNRTDLSRSANRYLKHIYYGNRTPRQSGEDLTQRNDWMFEVVFDYGENHIQNLDADDEGRQFVAATVEEQQLWPVRRDPISGYRPGFEVRTYRLCRNILMFHHFPDELGVADYLVRATRLGLNESPINTVLARVTQSGYLRRQDGTYQSRSLPPVEFEYSQAEIQSEVHDIDSESLENLPVGLAGSRYRWVDLDGEGIAGILTEQDGGWSYKANLGHAQFAPQETLAATPSLAAANSGQQLLDLAGDGQLDLVTLAGPAPGFYERTPDRAWADHRAFDSVPSVDWRDPNLRFVDLTGDGHADVLVTEDQVLTWYPSLAEAGYGPSRRMSQAEDDETGPRLVFADATQSIYLADMSGDGLTDLVRIRNGLLCYWPNLGYGRFGAKVSMDSAPWFDAPDNFDPQRIRLADVDGSGITDILYIQSDRVAVYFNQAGNGWADARFIDRFPRIDNLSDVTVTDLLGNGTACLVWSSPLPGDTNRRMRYIDLMGGQKPHLMIASRNNLGAETRLQYAASTKFYLEDKAAGRPWITRLPFPVQVVERVETYDHISRNRFVSRYSYHHGYFDGIEREFRGFGLVEQWDTEEFVALSNGGTLPDGGNLEESSHIPPVYTKTWFHTGVYLGRRHISNFFAGLLDESDTGEYYREPGLSDEEAARLLLPDTPLPEGLSVQEAGQACRALKGAMLRQEVYALDGTEQEPHPYTVTEQNFTIRMLQPRAGNRHGVFFSHPREALNYQYERHPADPRITHTLTLDVDDFGNVLQSAAIGYGRRQPDPDLQPADQQTQEQLLITCAENSYTNPVEEEDNYRIPLPSEVRSFELSGLTLNPGQMRFSFAQMQQTVQSAALIAYHQTPGDGLQKRLLEQVRTRYRPDDLGASRNDPLTLLPSGELEPLALTGESYTLSFTQEHLDLLFEDRVTETMLVDDGRYVNFDDDDNWWIPSGRVFMSPAEDGNAAQELAFARQHFYMPFRYRDPFGRIATVDYDTHNLLMVQTIDPLENRVTARHDYRLLIPELVTDPNGNRSTAAFDVLGMVAGTAVMGKATESAGDSLDGFQPQLTQSQIDAFFVDPRGPIAAELLGNATSRIIYDETRFQRLAQPTFAATIVREIHLSDLDDSEVSAVQISLVYSDGYGRTIQNKVQAEPGPVEEGGDIANPRWTASGWTIFNNKGKPVKQYEPFFSTNHAFEFGVIVGVSPTLFYDPVGRVVATLHPNHTWEKTVFDSWRQTRYDVNDTVLMNPAGDPDIGDYFQRRSEVEYLPTWHALRTDPANAAEAAARWPDVQRRQDEADAAAKSAAHAATPAVVHFDARGRPFLSIADNGPGGQYRTRTEQDIEGNPLRIIDNRDNVVMAYQVEGNGNPPVLGYDAAGRQLYENSMDAAERRVLPDIGGKPIRRWDSRGHIRRSTYDALQRPTHLFVQREGEPELLAERTVYGEGHPNAESMNLRGKVYQVYDGAGVMTRLAIDFKGNLRESRRQLAREYRTAVDWSVLAVSTEIAAIEAAAGPLLESDVFLNRTAYDALNRPVAITTPDDSVTLPTYNAANLLEQLAARLQDEEVATSFVSNIDYNARGQRERITYATADGTDMTTTYAYDPETFRLNRLHTVRHRDSRDLQDLRYTYDAAGNITSIRDHAQQTVFFNNSQVEPHNDYTYDPLYRLIQAQGREHAAQNNFQRDATEFAPMIGIPFPNSPEALQRYMEEYDYDGVGNILSLRHIGGAVERWTRRYQYAADSNRLLATSLPGDGANEFSAPYTYDAHGNMTTLLPLPLMQWDFKDQLQASSRQVVNAGTPETTYYVYDAAGQRVRKVTERFQPDPNQEPTRMAERLYIGPFETFRRFEGDGNTITLERQTLHITDGPQCIALVDTRTHGEDGSPERAVRYQLRNHLGSAVLEVDHEAVVITYEEYHAYGTTSFHTSQIDVGVNTRRFRFAGGERDEHTGFYHYGKRYYAAWLVRWISPDPIGTAGGRNLYQYARNNPVMLKDLAGTAPEDPDNPDPLPGVKIRVGIQKGKVKAKIEPSSGKGNADTPTRRRSTRTMRGRKAQIAEGVFRAAMDILTPGSTDPTDPDAPVGDETPTGTSERLDQELERDKNKAPTPPETKPKPGGPPGPDPPDSPPRLKKVSFGTVGSQHPGMFDDPTIEKPKPKPLFSKPKPPPLVHPNSTMHVPPSVLVSPPLSESPPPSVKYKENFGTRILKSLGDLPRTTIEAGRSLTGRIGTLSARFFIPFVDEAMDVYESIGGAAGAWYLYLRTSTALRAGLSALGRGIAALGSTAGPLLAAAAVGVGVGSILDYFFDLSGKLANWYSDVTGMTDWLESLDARSGGRTTIRGMPQ